LQQGRSLLKLLQQPPFPPLRWQGHHGLKLVRISSQDIIQVKLSVFIKAFNIL
jgi:hypothetical protein